MIFETKRLILRPPRKSDWEDIAEGAGDLSVSKQLLAVPYPYKKKHATSWIKSCIKQSRIKKKKSYVFFMELKSEKKVIGVTDLHNVDPIQGIANTGSWINKKYWRKGYIIEAKIPVLDFAFKKLKLRKIETVAFSDNLASNNMSKKLGFKYEGTKRAAAVCKADGKIKDNILYGLLRNEWAQRRPILVKELEEKTR